MTASSTGEWLLRLGRFWFDRALLLLPPDLRQRAGTGMRSIFQERQREALREHGLLRLLFVWSSELAGVAAVAFVGRRELAQRTRIRGRRRVPGVLPDARIALRSMRRRPGPSLLAIATCALGIGGATAMFSVVDGVLLRPLPFRDAGRLANVIPTNEVWRDSPQFRDAWQHGQFSYPEFLVWREAQRSFVQAAAIEPRVQLLTGAGRAAELMVGITTWELFPMLGISAQRGRVFDAADGAPGGARLILISDAFWRTRLGGAVDVVGQTLQLNDIAHEIIGVLPADFSLGQSTYDIWVPRGGPATGSERGNHNLEVIGRLASGVTVEQATQESGRILRAIAEPDFPHDARVVPRLAHVTRDVRAPLGLLLAGSLVLLLAGCVNFAALQLGSGMDRDREVAVRSALGASRGRIVRQFLTESTLLSIGGGVIGVTIAWAITRVLVALAPVDVPRLDQVALDPRAIGLAFATAAVAGVVFGIVPAMVLSGSRHGLRFRVGAGAGRSRHRLHGTLAAMQVALATVLLLGAGLLVRTLVHLDRVDPGFAVDGLLTFEVSPLRSRFPAGEDRAPAQAAYMSRVADMLGQVPGVVAVARTAVLPFSSDRGYNTISLPDQSGFEGLTAQRNLVSGNYLDVIGATLVAGRLLAPGDDRSDAPKVAVVSERLARRLWPDGSPLNRRVTFWGGEFTVVGVVADTRLRMLEEQNDLPFFVPLGAVGESGTRIVARVSGDAHAVAADALLRLADFDADLAVAAPATMRERMRRMLADQRYRARLATCFAILSACFAALGLHGVIARRVRLRTQEIGVRMALGAGVHNVVSSVLVECMLLTAGGLVAGLLASALVTRALARWIVGVPLADPVALLGVAVVLGAVTVSAGLLPSLRAARLDPVQVLRRDG
jgi:putative ABC transport system permease protein